MNPLGDRCPRHAITKTPLFRSGFGRYCIFQFILKSLSPGGSRAGKGSYPLKGPVDSYVENTKGHGRIEQRRCEVSHVVDWMTGNRRFPGEYRFPQIATIIRIEAPVEHKTHCTWECRYYISSRTLTAEQAAKAVRAHWQIENALHWVLDVTFKEDLARVRKGHGAQNMAIVRHFAINIVRKAKDKRSIKLRRKIAGWDTKYLEKLITG